MSRPARPRIVGTADEIEHVVEAAESEASINAIAARDVEPPRPRWCVPILETLGEAEPDDDDSGDWILRDVIPRGESSLIVGPPKSGKSWSMMDIALSVALDEAWLGGSAEYTLGRPGRVVILALEDAERRLRSRLWRLARSRGLTPHDQRIRDGVCLSRRPVRIPDRDDLRAFRSELGAWRPDLVMVDCLARVMVGDESDASSAREYSSAITSLCADLGIATCVIHHTRKAPSDERYRPLTLDDVRGSGDIVASARHVNIWQRLPVGDERLVARLAAGGNLDLRVAERAVECVGDDVDGRPATRLVDRGDVGALLAESRATRRAERDERADAEMQRRERMALEIARDRGGVTAAPLTAVAGISDRTALRVIAGLVAAGDLTRGHQAAPATITDAGLARLGRGRC